MIHLKITKIGNSVGVILPKEILNSMNVSLGDTLTWTNSPDGFRVTPYDESLAQQLAAGRKVMKKRRNALRELAK